LFLFTTNPVDIPGIDLPWTHIHDKPCESRA
jgi:hypothetical protein